MKAILGKKISMSRMYDKKGLIIPVTLVEAGPCYIIQLKKEEKDGYISVQIGYGKSKKISKPELGHLKRVDKKIADLKLKYLKEIRTNDLNGLEEGTEFKVDIFNEGDKVSVTSTSKGKGFAGVMKRHGFHGSSQTHGHKHDHRKPGSIGAGFPEHVIKGKKMAGRMGSDKVKINSEVFGIDLENNLIILKGSVPGARNSLVFIKQ